jgi:hypothetical protein
MGAPVRNHLLAAVLFGTRLQPLRPSDHGHPNP